MPRSLLVYSTPTCPFCRMAKAFLDEHGVAYVDFDVSADRKAADEMVEKTGQMGVPVLDIDGQLIVGFDKEAISKALGI